MSTTRLLVAALCLAVATVPLAGSPADAASTPKAYKNCKALNADYPHGIGKKGAHDSTSGKPVTNFYVSNKGYANNSGRDRDGDGIACEKR